LICWIFLDSFAVLSYGSRNGQLQCQLSRITISEEGDEVQMVDGPTFCQTFQDFCNVVGSQFWAAARIHPCRAAARDGILV
jgi:hypothetical protein